jgi:hypothetical protein
MRSHFVHMFVPPRLLPLYVFLVGRRQCCGARWTAAHLDSCPRHPWSGRGEGRILEREEDLAGL